MKKIINVLAILIILLGGVYLWQNNFKKSGQFPNNEDSFEQLKPNVNVEFVFGDQRTENVKYEYPAAASYSLFAITKNIAVQKNWVFDFKDYGDMGVLITQIDQTKNGTDNKYWQFYVNDQMPQISADKFYPSATSTIKWIFQESQF